MRLLDYGTMGRFKANVGSTLTRIFHTDLELISERRVRAPGLQAKVRCVVGRVPSRGGRASEIFGLNHLHPERMKIIQPWVAPQRYPGVPGATHYNLVKVVSLELGICLPTVWVGQDGMN